MNKDDTDFFRYVKKEPASNSNIALDLINGLENRNYGNIKKNVKSKENIEIFAEEQFIRKKDFEEMRCEMPGQPRSTFLMVFSPDGSRVASTHGNHNIYITDILTGKHIRTLVGHPRTPWCIAFHPTSDQIVASGCLGGQVRIWDLSGGSEVWTAVNQTVIASLAFHPTDRVLVIATYNEIYFWDWSQPEPFVHVATSNPKEKVRFVAFDALGHKLITGIANSPQTRWERVRAPVPVPRQERSVSPYRRRITQRLVSVTANQQSQNVSAPSQDNASNRESLSNVPARVRRITICYRNLVREYEQLVQRYLQLYRPPTMIDRGTDPMEPNESLSNNSENPGPSTARIVSSNSDTNSEPRPGPSTQAEPGPSSTQAEPGPSNTQAEPGPSNTQAEPGSSSTHDNNSTSSSSHLLAPSRIFSLTTVNKPSVGIRGTQTSKTKKKTDDVELTEPERKRMRLTKNKGLSEPENNTAPEGSTAETPNEADSTQLTSYRTMLENFRREFPTNIPSSSNNTHSSAPGTSGFMPGPQLDEPRIPTERSAADYLTNYENIYERRRPQYSTNVDELLHNIRRTAEEEVRNRILPIIRSVPVNDRPELIRLFENSREHVRMRFRQMYPALIKKQTRRDRRNINVVDTTSDSSSSDEDNSNSTTVDPRRSSDQSSSSLNNQNTTHSTSSNATTSNSNPPSSSSTVRNFNTELEQLVTSLLTEIERNETDRTSNNSNSNVETGITRQIVNPAAQNPGLPIVVPLNDTPAPAVQTGTSSPTNRTMPFFQRFLQRRNTSLADIPPPIIPIRTPAFETVPSDTDNGRASSPVFMNFVPRRRRFFSHRISAFMPTRVNYNRNSRLRRPTHTVGRGRLGSLRNPNVSSLDVDELINYSERENSEEDTPQPLDLSNHTTPENGGVNNMYSNIRLGNVYSNIIHDLESSLSDVIRMRASNRPGETSDMLGSFSERLENIMQQSDTILRNLSHSMDMLSNSAEPNTNRTQNAEPSWSFFDQNFYVRDQRAESTSQDTNREEILNLSDIFNSRPPFNSATSDHTYPRNPDNAHSSSQSEGISPLMTSIHMTISHIQRQARLLRRQVESIERIDRAMLEVAQLQLIRQLIIELVRHVRTLSGETRSTGMSSVRQMMAGTRISDSSPYESPTEDATPQENNNQSNNNSSTSNAGEQSTSSNGPTRPRTSHRKTYPPGRLFRLGRQSRRPSIINFFSRRYTRSERNSRTNPFSRVSTHEPCPNYTYINTYTLSSMTRRLQHLLVEQVQNLTPPTGPQHHQQQERTNSRSTVDLGEHMLASRLHACLLRVNRLIGNNINVDPVENLYVGQSTTAVTQDGESRYRARHCLTMIIECMSRHIEELGNSSIPSNMRQQFHGVLVMSLLLTELLLLVIVDSIPPPTGINLNPERASLTSRIDHMVTQLLQSRSFSHSHQLTRSLRLMKLTMRHAHTALGQTYQTRRNEMLPRINTNRQQVLGSINRCLRFINRQRETPVVDTNVSSTNNPVEDQLPSNNNSNTQDQGSSNQDASNGTEWYSNIYDFFLRRYPNNRDEDGENRPSTSGRDRVVPQNDPSSTNDNTDGDDDETDGYNNNYIPHSTNSYRTNNVNVAGGSGQPPRIWNVPAVQVNDVPISEPSTFTQRVINQRQRFAERVSELRSNPSVGLFRPRFLHPLYASVMNPFDADLDDVQREPLYDGDMITTVTPNHRIQAWDVSDWTVPMPEISDALKNVVVSECKIHNDASVDVAKDGTILVTLLPSGGYLNVTNKLGVYSLKWETLGQCLYITCFEQNAVSVSLSPLSRHLIVGLTHRIITNDRWVMARIFKIDQKDVPGDRLPVLRELEQSRDSRINCIRWLPISGQGLIYATNTGQLVVLS